MNAELHSIARAVQQALRNTHKNEKFLISLGTASHWIENDRVWFADNPSRSFRLRKILPGERQEADRLCGSGMTHVLVRQIQPGFRDRTMLAHSHGLLDSLPDDDIVYSALWTELRIRKNKKFSLGKIMTAAASMKAMGGGFQ